MKNHQAALKSRVSKIFWHLISNDFMGRKEVKCLSATLSAKLLLKMWLQIILKMVLALGASIAVKVPGAQLLHHITWCFVGNKHRPYLLLADHDVQ